MLVTEQAIKDLLTDRQALAFTMHFEAGGDNHEGESSVEERLAVGCVVRNRLYTKNRWGKTYRTVCLAKLQFSCWNPGPDANHLRLMAWAEAFLDKAPTDPLLVETFWLADGIMTERALDHTNGATSYYAPAAMVPKGSKPSWVYRNGTEVPPVATIGRQIFYKGV